MDQEQVVKRALSFKRAAKRLFNTPDGLKVLAYLKDSYVDTVVLSSSTNETIYKLGQKELLQSLIKLVKEEQLEEVIVRSNISED